MTAKFRFSAIERCCYKRETFYNTGNYLKQIVDLWHVHFINCFIVNHLFLLELAKPKIDISDQPQKLEAQDRSPIILTIADNVTALTNTRITIQCSASGVPTPTVTWTKDGQEITNDDRYTVQDDNALLIDGSLGGDSAQYRCTAISVAGEDRASSSLQVVGKLSSHKNNSINPFWLSILIQFRPQVFIR